MEAIAQKNDLLTGAKVTLDVNGRIYHSKIEEIRQGFLYLTSLQNNGRYVRMIFNQPVYLMQESEGGGFVYVLLRYMEHNAKSTSTDVFRIVRSTFSAVSGDAMRVPMCSECDLTIFSIFNRQGVEFSGRVRIYELSETGIGLVVTRNIPHDTFAECEFELGDMVLKLPSRAVHGIVSTNGAYHRMWFDFVCVSKYESRRIREALFSEQARRMRELPA